MILTEEEARTKRCHESFGPLYVTQQGAEAHTPFHTAEAHTPFHTAVAFPAGAYAISTMGHNFPTVSSPSHCIGSACMAWRWHQPEGYEDMGVTACGYCGKAGKP